MEYGAGGAAETGRPGEAAANGPGESPPEGSRPADARRKGESLPFHRPGVRGVGVNDGANRESQIDVGGERRRGSEGVVNAH